MTNMNKDNAQNSNGTAGTIASVNNPGNSQAQGVVQTPVDKIVQPTPGPDAAFAAMRQENERLVREMEQARAITQDPEIIRFMEQRNEAALKEQAQAQNLSVEAAERIAKLEAQQTAFVAQQSQQAAATNLQSFAQTHEMDAEALSTFANWMDTTYPDMANMAASTPNFDFKPYLAAFNPNAFAAYTSGGRQSNPTPLYIPGHGSAQSANSQSEHDKMMAFIKEEAKR